MIWLYYTHMCLVLKFDIQHHTSHTQLMINFVYNNNPSGLIDVVVFKWKFESFCSAQR